MFIWTSNIPLIRLVIILNMNQRPLGDVSNSFQTRLLFPYQRKEGGGGGERGEVDHSDRVALPSSSGTIHSVFRL